MCCDSCEAAIQAYKKEVVTVYNCALSLVRCAFPPSLQPLVPLEHCRPLAPNHLCETKTCHFKMRISQRELQYLNDKSV